MDLQTAYEMGLAKHTSMNSGSLTYNNGTTTLTCSVYKSYQRDSNKDQQDAGYLDSLDNLYVLAKASDIQTWGLLPMVSRVTLDGEPFLIGRTIGKTNAYWQIYLRLII